MFYSLCIFPACVHVAFFRLMLFLHLTLRAAVALQYKDKAFSFFSQHLPGLSSCAVSWTAVSISVGATQRILNTKKEIHRVKL